MKNAKDVNERIKGTAAYITAAVLAVFLTLFARYADGNFSVNTPFHLTELSAELLMIVSVAVYLGRHGKEEKRSIKKHLLFAAIPVILALAACFYVPEGYLSKSGAASAADILLSALTDDLILCSLGCHILLHKCRFGSSGVVLMVLCMSLYEAAICGQTGEKLLVHTAAAAIIGYFEIYLHLSTESPVFCCVFRFLLNFSLEFTEEYSVSDEPFFGEKTSAILYIASLSVMVVFAFILRNRLKMKRVYMDGEE